MKGEGGWRGHDMVVAIDRAPVHPAAGKSPQFGLRSEARFLLPQLNRGETTMLKGQIWLLAIAVGLGGLVCGDSDGGSDGGGGSGGAAGASGTSGTGGRGG